MNDNSDKISGDIIWAERSHSPPNIRDYQRADNILRWKKLSDWAAENKKTKYILTKNYLDLLSDTVFSSKYKAISKSTRQC